MNPTNGEKRAAQYREIAAAVRRGQWDRVGAEPTDDVRGDERATIRRAWYLAEVAQGADGPRLDRTQARTALLLEEAARLAIAAEVDEAMGR